jgi:hypothetical protein
MLIYYIARRTVKMEYGHSTSKLLEHITYHRLLNGALMPNNLQCSTDSEHHNGRTQSFLQSAGVFSNLHAEIKRNTSNYERNFDISN